MLRNANGPHWPLKSPIALVFVVISMVTCSCLHADESSTPADRNRHDLTELIDALRSEDDDAAATVCAKIRESAGGDQTAALPGQVLRFADAQAMAALLRLAHHRKGAVLVDAERLERIGNKKKMHAKNQISIFEPSSTISTVSGPNGL